MYCATKLMRVERMRTLLAEALLSELTEDPCLGKNPLSFHRGIGQVEHLSGLFNGQSSQRV